MLKLISFKMYNFYQNFDNTYEDTIVSNGILRIVFLAFRILLKILILKIFLHPSIRKDTLNVLFTYY